VTNEKDSGHRDSVVIGHLVSDGELLSSGEWEVDCSNEVRDIVWG